ncbi:hypothetical protein BU25DRAFT_419929 [Macroventuria anomochaeta]|uniref:Uncharacterized protein n=1 Tax=Macroventuria anomochaeta TaxID=301207 RepID=A0ACB6S6P3_9PLEO|nr:uncharacterized protein BU25DRAFT_419929 [Macroventuria anomochaeta]KAF2629638.1 hypothetical protein BU25DRAFT_419929 [Macroventuria anomochaeta]
MSSMTQQLAPERPMFTWGGWRGSTLTGQFAGDLGAAAVSATLISPVLTAIDRAVVENAARPGQNPLAQALKTNILCSFKHPRRFFGTKSFLIIWTLYAATYTTANTVETTARHLTQKADDLFVQSVTFLSTITVNVPLGVWKDVRFVQMFGRPSVPVAAQTKGAKVPPPPVPRLKFPRTVAATFLIRDAITIFGAVNLPPMIASSLPEDTFANPILKMATMQLLVPVFSQVFATPIHLLGLDMYSHPDSAVRMARIRQNLGATTLVRCARIIPAFGVGLIANTGLRDYFHEKAG